MEGLDLTRRAVQVLTGRGAGINSRLPRYLVGHQKRERLDSEIAALPVDTSSYVPLQNINTGSTFFRIDIHSLDDGHLMS